MLAAVRACGLTRPPRDSRRRAAPARPPPQPRARRPRRAPPLRRLQRVLRPLPRRVDDLQLRAVLARREHAGGGAGREARDGRHEARPARGRAGARRRLRLGQLRDPCRARARRAGRRHHALPRQAEQARRRVAEAGLEDRVEIRVWTTATWGARPASASTRSPRSGWSSTSARSRSTSTRACSRGLLEPGGRLLNHGIARLRHTDAEAGPFSERYVFPDAAPLHLSRILLALERAGFETDHVEGLRQDYVDTLSRLDRPSGRQPRGRRARWRAASGCASGVSTCAPRATASEPGLPRSTRCSATALSGTPGRRIPIGGPAPRLPPRFERCEELPRPPSPPRWPVALLGKPPSSSSRCRPRSPIITDSSRACSWVTRVTPTPLAPARAVRPMRWT